MEGNYDTSNRLVNQQEQEQQQQHGESSTTNTNNSSQFIVPSDNEILEAIGKPVPAMFIPGDSFKSMKLPGPNDWLNRYKEEGQTFYNFVSSQEESPEEETEGKRIYLVPIGPFENKENAPDLNILLKYISVFFNCEDVQLLPRVELIGENQLKEEEQKRTETSREHSRQSLSAKTKNSADVKIAKQRKCAQTYRNDHAHWNFTHDSALTIQSQDKPLTENQAAIIPVQRKKKKRKKEKVEKKKMYLKINNTYEAVTCRKALDHDQVQLSISDVLDVLEMQVLPDDAFCMIALTLTDLYMDDDDLFVVGWAGNCSALFSFARYDPNFTHTLNQTSHLHHTVRNDLKVNQRIDLILRRCLKTVVHETLHLFGLRHCIYYSCLMNGTASLLEDDETPMFMCPICERKLQYILKFDVINRYRKMQDFFENYLSTHDFDEDIRWLKHRISFLESIQHDNSDASKYGDILLPMKPSTSLERDVFLSPMDPPLHSMNDLLISQQRSGNRNRCRCNIYLCKFSPDNSNNDDTDELISESNSSNSEEENK